MYTLWAACSLARCSAARGDLEHDQKLIDDAKAIFRDGLQVCERNLGPNHIGTLMGRQHQADVLVREKSYADAEREYRDIAERQKSVPGARAGTHRDRIITLQQLAECYKKQDRLIEALDVCNSIMTELDALGAQKHPIYERMRRKQQDLNARAGASAKSKLDSTSKDTLRSSSEERPRSLSIRKSHTS